MRQKSDYVSLLLILAIGSLSLLTTFAINGYLARNQLIFWVLGLATFYVASHIDHTTIKKVTLPLFVICVILLIVLFKVGDPVRGSVRWIDLGFFRFQAHGNLKTSLLDLLLREFPPF
ncbi:FtsW/RodA/SpoVE family cell cycle protein [Candidatus Curtissbacteria bacterium]|nr:FtsW/RodA/SpoVE family cell cycle protein [Candidatus Curtissbacteria bacterium]